MITSWDDMDYWGSKDWENVQEKLDELDRLGVTYNPSRVNMFRPFDLEFSRVRVAFVGQDPYPDPRYATGLPFSIPPDVVGFPPTLQMIFREYCRDLSLPYPRCGDLSPWANQGVFLWNVIPTCEAWKSLSHRTYTYGKLTEELMNYLSTNPIVIILLGSYARYYSTIVNYSIYLGSKVKLIELVHPSPRANIKISEHRFINSRVFSRTNDLLISLGQKPIDWRLP